MAEVCDYCTFNEPDYYYTKRTKNWFGSDNYVICRECAISELPLHELACLVSMYTGKSIIGEL